jgi:hypothetical protein
MIGSAPIFYRIPITQELLLSVVTAQYPPLVTVVQRFVPPVTNPLLYVQDGMVRLNNRRVILQCYEAFKQFVVCCFSPIAQFLTGTT